MITLKEGLFAYHATPRENVEGISKEGIIPQPIEGVYSDEESSNETKSWPPGKPGTFIALTRDAIEVFIDMSIDGDLNAGIAPREYVIYNFNLPKAMEAIADEDPRLDDQSIPGGHAAYIVFEVITPECLPLPEVYSG